MCRELRFATARAATLVAAVLLAPPLTVRAAEAQEVAAVERAAVESLAAAGYRERARPILAQYCFGCHGDGATEGETSLDAAEAGDALFADVELWARALRNVRGGIMPPAGEPRPTSDELEVLADWIKQEVYGIDYDHPDPGRSALRRLNRSEYGNTIRDLMGVDFDAEFLFPPDDSGYGFDNIGDALSMSPLLMEKYLQAADDVVRKAVPAVSLQAPERTISAEEFRAIAGRGDGRMLRLDEHCDVRHTVQIAEPGDYRIELLLKEDGSFEYVTSRAMTAFLVDGQQAHAAEHVWEENKNFTYQHDYRWDAGPHTLSYVVTPLPPVVTGPTEDGEGSLIEEEGYANIEFLAVKVVGPLDPAKRVSPPGHDKFFPRPLPPTEPAERTAYAREVLEQFAKRVFRRPADEATIDRLVAIAENSFADPDRTFEQGIRDAMTATLASSRFLFRQEAPAASEAGAKYPLVDDFTLASRLSYFLWGTLPDDELFALAAAGELRDHLPEQVERMRRDSRSRTMLRNFVGQWLRARDVETVPLNTLAILGLEEEYTELRAKMQARGFRRRRGDGPDPLRERLLELRDKMTSVDTELRSAMRQETERHFQYIVEEDRSLLELIDCDYAFLNDKLARYYGLPRVRGDDIRRVELPEGSVRGGILAQGTALLVTSNPTRTSPVKRGLYVLENLLGTPPPPPPVVPPLEDAADHFEGRDPPLRELLAFHRASPLCASCHQRMDPLGLAIENFNALGQWRTRDGDANIDPAGELVSGEEFADLAELKKILVGPRRLDFYRCVTEKLMTFALGRGVEPQDQQTIDQIVEQLEAGGGRFRILLDGIINSPAFQRMRRPDAESVAAG